MADIGAHVLTPEILSKSFRSSARDLYVSCFLYTRRQDVARDPDEPAETYAPRQCASLALFAVRQWEGRNAGSRRFCLPTLSRDLRPDPPTAMAGAYLDYFERNGRQDTLQPGIQVFLSAMVNKWPCDTTVPRRRSEEVPSKRPASPKAAVRIDR